GHQPLERGVAEALAQAQGAGDLDEEQAAGGLVLAGLVDLLQQPAARGQPGFRMGTQGRQRGHALLALRARALDAVGDRGDEVARAYRLAEEIVGAGLQHLELALRIRVAGRSEERRGGKAVGPWSW